MNSSNIWQWNAVKTTDALKKKKISAVDAVQSAIDRLDEVNEKVNAVVVDLREEALIKAGIATHTKKEAKKLARNGEYPVENFRAKPNMTVTIFYWPNKEIGKPYTVYH